MENRIIGYKVFNSDWTCRGFQYEVGKTYEIEGSPIICERGFHFCTNLTDCFLYYSLDPLNTKIAEVEAFGECDVDDLYTKMCTNKIKILREIFYSELEITTRFGSERVRLLEKEYEIGDTIPVSDVCCTKDMEPIMRGTVRVCSKMQAEYVGYAQRHAYFYDITYLFIEEIREKRAAY